MKNVKIAIMGMGTVGGGVYRLIQQEGERIAKQQGIQLEVKKTLALDYSVEVPDSLKAADVHEIASDPEISIVIELRGGIEPAKTFITTMLEAGKTVVSANKQLIANAWPELEASAKKGNAGFYFEASVGGAIPILRVVNTSLQANTIHSIEAIINGTTNFIMTKMCDEGGDFEEVLREAQALGYAEADPTADVDGFDAMYKLSILSSLAFCSRMPIDKIYREGIRKVSKKDIDCIKALGKEVKLLAIGKKQGNQVELRVHPTIIPRDHMLATVKGSFNAVFLKCSMADDLMFYGRGAGDLPTASAVVSDVLNAAVEEKPAYAPFENVEGKVEPGICFNTNWEAGYYLRLGCGAKETAKKAQKVLGEAGIQVSQVIDLEDDTVLIVEKAKELEIQEAVKKMGGVASLLRMQ